MLYKGWSQEVLAERADMHRTYLASIERALRNPSRSVRKLDLPESVTVRYRAPQFAIMGNPMLKPLDPFRFLLIAVAGWMNQHQRQIIDYFREENRVLREQLGGRRLRLTDD